MKRYRFVSLIGAAAAVLAVAPVLWAAPQPGHVQTRGIPAVALSWRGQYLATITRQLGKPVLTLANVDGSNARAIAIPDGCKPDAVRWASNRNLLAVLSRCSAGASRASGAVWILDVNDKQPLRKLASFEGTASQLQWRNDGKVVAFLYKPAAVTTNTVRAGVIAAVPASGGALHAESPTGFDIHEFHLGRYNNVMAYTATPAADPSALPKLYTVIRGQTRLAFDPAAATGDLHDVRVSSPRWSVSAGTPSPLFFLGKSATGPATTGGNLYLRVASHQVPIANLTGTGQGRIEWFMPTMGVNAFATRIVDGSTQLMGYTTSGAGTGLQGYLYSWRDSRVLCTIPGIITDGHGPGSMAFASGPSGGKVAYFEYPDSAGPPVLRVRSVSVRQCNPQQSVDLAVASR